LEVNGYHLVSEYLFEGESVHLADGLEELQVDLFRIGNQTDVVVASLDVLLLELDNVLQSQVLGILEDGLIGIFSKAELLCINIAPKDRSTNGALGTEPSLKRILGILEGSF